MAGLPAPITSVTTSQQGPTSAAATSSSLDLNSVPNASPTTGAPQSLTSVFPDSADKRLFTSIPRSALAVTTNSEWSVKGPNPGGYISDRGKIASIRWLTSKKDLSVAASSAKGNRYQPGGDLQIDLDLLSSDYSEGFDHFFLTGFSTTYSEKTQIHSTFGDNEIVYYFGRQPVVFNLEGILFDTLVDDWFSKFINLYWGYLRGSQLAKYFELVEITLPNMRIKGSILSLGHSQDSSIDQLVKFNMQFLAKEFIPIPISRTDTLEVLSAMQKYSPISFSASKLGPIHAAMKKGATLKDSNKGVKGTGSASKPTYTTISNVLKNLPDPQVPDALKNVSSSIENFTSSVFSPVFSIVASIAQTVQTVTGTISASMKTITTPLSNLLATVRLVDNQVQQLVGLVEKDVADLVSIPSRLMGDLNHTLKDLKNTAGIISRLPESLSQVVTRSITSGIQSQASKSAVLSSGKKRVKSKGALLQSGKPYHPAKAYTL